MAFLPSIEKHFYILKNHRVCDIINSKKGGATMKENLLLDKSIVFASRIIKL